MGTFLSRLPLLLALFMLVACGDTDQTNERNNTAKEQEAKGTSEQRVANVQAFGASHTPETLSAGDSLLLIRNELNTFILEDEVVLIRPVEGDTTGINRFIFEDEVVLIRPDTSGIELKVEEVLTDTAKVGVVATNVSPSTVEERPDYVFDGGASFIMLDFNTLKIFGFRYEATANQTEDPEKGMWEFGLDEIASAIIPDTTYVAGKKELWIYLE